MSVYPRPSLDTNYSRGSVFYCCSTFHSHSRISNNESNSYPKISLKRPLAYKYQLSSRWRSPLRVHFNNFRSLTTTAKLLDILEMKWSLEINSMFCLRVRLPSQTFTIFHLQRLGNAELEPVMDGHRRARTRYACLWLVSIPIE
jgi:hypothetical protein